MEVKYNSDTYKILFRENNISGRQVDVACKNKWNWPWLEEKDVNGDFISDCIRKMDASGLAFCIHCNKSVSYGSSGKKDILAHARKSPNHLRNKKDFHQGTHLPLSWSQPSSTTELHKCTPKLSECTLPYGIAENVHTTSKYPAMRNKINPIVGLVDRKRHLEAFVISFMVENSLPLSTVPKFIEFAKNFPRDHKALSEMKMNRTATSYKLVDRLKVYERKKFVDAVKSYPFSINIDECTSNNHRKVFSILVSNFDEVLGLSVVQHYKSVSMTEVNVLTLFQTICKLLQEDQILFENLASDLSDSSNYMRGKKSGLEKRIRCKPPQLLNVDGDCCHHVHNSIRVFSQPFDNLVEKFIDDIHTDNKWSTDIRDALKEIRFLLNILFRMLPLRISHRWLLLYDCLSVNISMFDAFVLLYYSWVPDKEKDLYKEDICLL